MRALICVVAVLALFLASTSAYNVRPNFPSRLTRTVTATKDGDHGFILRAVNVVSKGVGSAVQFWASTVGFPRLRASYFTKDSDGSSATTYRTGLFALAEYNDTGAHDIRGTNAARIVQYLRLVDQPASSWSTMTHNVNVVNGTNVHVLQTTLTTSCTRPSSCPGTITVAWQAMLAESTVQYDLNTTLAPNVMKFDLTINWPFLRTGNKLGIVVGVMSGQAFTDGTNSVPLTNDAENAIIMGGDSDASFAWATEVAATFPSSVTANVPLLESPLWAESDFSNFTSASDNDVQANEQHHGFFFTFNQAGVAGQTGQFYWDPASSLPDGSGSSPASTVTTSMLAIVAAMFVAIAAQRMAL